ncbi:hypothetical protein ACIOHG_36615, partial [Kitasatospora sp. NPDC088134]
MAWIDDSMIERAATYLWTAGRVLEQRRFAHHFGPAPDPVGVLAALDAHCAPGGGWAYGLEPDVRGPAAQPLAAGAAARILVPRQATFARRDARHPLSPHRPKTQVHPVRGLPAGTPRARTGRRSLTA